MDLNYPDVVLRPVGGRKCRVVFSYAPQNEDELELKEKDEIEFISEVEEGWWRGRLAGKVGVFPSNFVVELPDSTTEELSASEGSAPLSSPEEPVPVLPPKPIREQCRVLFSYEAAIEDELTLNKGDIVTIITKDLEDKGWWKGELRGKIGLFPDNFVELITPVEEVKPKQTKPDRPAKNAVQDGIKADSKIPLISSIGTKKSEVENIAANNPTADAAKTKTDLGLIKPDTVAAHRKSLEEKVASEAAKKPQRPPVTGKPKPVAAAKPANVKRLSAEITDLVDGALQSKLNSRLKSIDILEPGSEDLDLDSVARSDMLTNITASRPRAPGRRPPSYAAGHKEIDGVVPTLTNGSSEVKVEISPKEKQKQHLPFMDELRVNLKSSKPVVDTADRKSDKTFGLWGSKVNSQSSSETSVMTNSSHEVKSSSTSAISPVPAATSHKNDATTNKEVITVAKHSVATSHVAEFATHRESTTTSSSFKISDLPPYDDKMKGGADGGQDGTKREVTQLKWRVEKLEKMVTELTSLLKEETDKRRQIEKELVKLTDLVTQV